MPPRDPQRALSFADLLAENGRGRPHQIAVVDGDLRLTWAESTERIARVAGSLDALGVGSGDRVLWLGQNSFRVMELLGACARLGAILCPANWRSSAEELAFVVEDLEPALVVWQEEEIGAVVRDVRKRSTGRARWIGHDVDGDDSYEVALLRDGPRDVETEVDPSAPVLALYTAAFGGTPNAALLSHTALFTQDLVIGRMLEISDESTFLTSGPLFHVATLMVATSVAHHGGCNVFLPRVDAEAICRAVEAERVTHAFLPRPTIEQIREVNADGRFDLSSLWEAPDPDRYRGGIIGPVSCPWTRKPGGFGQTEVMGLCTFAGLGAAAEGTSGRSSPAALVRVFDDGDEAPVGEAGEIVVRGPIVTSGYFRRPELTAERSRGGWHHTGDLGRRERDGSLTFIGPMVRMIKSASENIYPAEVEAALMSHPAVAAACVIGVPDPEWSQRVKAIVVANDGASVTADELVEHCRSRIASYKKPREVVLVDHLPRTPVGFVDRDAVDAEHGGGGYPGAGA